MMLLEQIKKDIAKAISNFKFPISNAEIEVTRTSDPEFGDFATNLPLKISRGSKQSPMESARLLADSLKDLPYVEKLEVKEPGFINFFLKNEVWQKQVEDVLNRVSKYGANEIAKGQKARVEFVSANPTGPLHFGNARGGPIGDSLASVLEFCGWKVLREYYHNDVGEQVGKLGQSILKVAAGLPLEDQEYKGEYVRELVRELSDEAKKEIRDKINPSANVTNISIDWEKCGKEAIKKLLDNILSDCELMGIKFDKVYPESGFIEFGKTQKALDFLKTKSVLKEKDGALWFAPK